MATTTEIPVTLDKDEILRYSRHLIMPEVGMEGQQKLKAARVLCIGAGGLGVFIFRGVAMVSNSVILAGAIPAALLAIGVDLILGWVEEKLTPKA